jgi:hypothetical protein
LCYAIFDIENLLSFEKTLLMAWFKRSSRFTILSTILAVALTLGLIVNAPKRVQAQWTPSSLSNKLPTQWEFRPPRAPGQPVNTVSGGTRGGCNQGEAPPIALVPDSKIGTTIAEYPTVFWYMPPTSASAAEFLLRDAKDNDVYRVRYALAQSALPDRQASAFPQAMGVEGTPGLMSLSLPAFANLSPLEIGQDYYWVLALICSPIDRSGEPSAEGWIRRVEPNPNLALRVNQATPEERVALYADARLWYDTVNTLVELRRDRPNNNDLADAWNKLLNSAGLGTIAKKQVVR